MHIRVVQKAIPHIRFQRFLEEHLVISKENPYNISSQLCLRLYFNIYQHTMPNKQKAKLIGSQGRELIHRTIYKEAK